MNMYGSCRLLSHGSTTNNIETVNGNKQIVKTSKQSETRKEYCPSFDHTKINFGKTVYQKPFVSERYFVALPFITSLLLHMVHCFVIIESLLQKLVNCRLSLDSWLFGNWCCRFQSLLVSCLLSDTAV